MVSGCGIFCAWVPFVCFPGVCCGFVLAVAVAGSAARGRKRRPARCVCRGRGGSAGTALQGVGAPWRWAVGGGRCGQGQPMVWPGTVGPYTESGWVCSALGSKA